jgi:hypothetical protein
MEEEEEVPTARKNTDAFQIPFNYTKQQDFGT